MKFQNQNDKLVDRFEDWWRRDNKGLPLMWVVARRDGPRIPFPAPKDDEDRYIGLDLKLGQTIANLKNNLYLADSYAQASSSIGPGSLAVYLGSKPVFTPNTVWYEPCIKDITNRQPIKFDPNGYWFKKHFDVLKELKKAAGNNDYIVNFPDLVENIDILAALRGTEELLIDMIDEPEAVSQALDEIYETYFPCYDLLYDALKTSEGVSSFYCFCVIGRGKVAKVQCDFSAMISPEHYRKFVLPTMKKQVKRLNHSVYHLDGPDAVRHLPAIMEIEELDALQWTAGAGKPDGAAPCWYNIYDQVAAAGKCLWVQIYEGNVDNWINRADRFLDRYGTKACYLLFPGMSERDADKLMSHAHAHWVDNK